MITRIEAHIYRCFPKLAVDLDRHPVLAGVYGAGKTPVLDTFGPDWESLLRPALPGDPGRVVPSGQDLSWLAVRLWRADPEEFAAWTDPIRTPLPQVEEIRAIEREPEQS